MPPTPIIVFTTAASSEEADRLAEMLMESKMAACVQILPQIQSVYRWQGNIERSSEVLLLIKTELSLFDELEKRVRASHSYDTPEILAVPAAAISAPYLSWLTANISTDEG